MNKQHIKNLLLEIETVFSRKKYTEDHIISIQGHLREVKDESFEYIRKRITELDTFPMNIIKTIKRFYYEWYGNNYEYFTNDCQSCNGDGYYLVYKVDEYGKYKRFISWCPHCRVGASSNMTIEQLEEQGYAVCPPKMNPLIFERSLGIVSDIDTDQFSDEVKKILEGHIPDMKIEPKRLEALTEYEKWDTNRENENGFTPF